jgi:hypothetical protein
MRRAILAGATAAVMAGLVGLGHNMGPTLASHQTQVRQQAVLPKRIVDEQRRNQKLKQKRRRAKRRQLLQQYTRAQRKAMRFGPGYRPGKLFRGHRI